MSIKHNIKTKGGNNNAGFYGRSEGKTHLVSLALGER